MREQKYHHGDLVRIAKDLGRHMQHFQSDCEAIVIGSYADQYGGGERERQEFTLHIKGSGQRSWYEERQLLLIETQQFALLEQWKKDEAEAEKLASDLDWIFANGAQVLEKTHGATIASLSRCIGIKKPWGKNGEGITWYANAWWTITLARPFLEANDKTGYLKFCERLRSTAKSEFVMPPQ
ncbi:MAG: hypothetical protein ACRDAM_15905 [Casimicrobium sp.]